eukprot:CAMPEP_0204041214 /NCGR_PEP_ID=MMETSP0360-20130528/93698_1 /ASSEMBLY_ACC=CAM_ASM_000342 /TAXON_ID=268821 /ORGANISM="Scrippsiella Hangoei, Strain SHTV-5" /LENGTH=38 /DNA_ID= /DNA_START= /DNA_END= /DNA_ORIENTATION=
MTAPMRGFAVASYTAAVSTSGPNAWSNAYLFSRDLSAR